MGDILADRALQGDCYVSIINLQSSQYAVLVCFCIFNISGTAAKFQNSKQQMGKHQRSSVSSFLSMTFRSSSFSFPRGLNLLPLDKDVQQALEGGRGTLAVLVKLLQFNSSWTWAWKAQHFVVTFCLRGWGAMLVLLKRWSEKLSCTGHKVVMKTPVTFQQHRTTN